MKNPDCRRAGACRRADPVIASGPLMPTGPNVPPPIGSGAVDRLTLRTPGQAAEIARTRSYMLESSGLVSTLAGRIVRSSTFSRSNPSSMRHEASTAFARRVPPPTSSTSENTIWAVTSASSRDQIQTPGRRACRANFLERWRHVNARGLKRRRQTEQQARQRSTGPNVTASTVQLSSACRVKFSRPLDRSCVSTRMPHHPTAMPSAPPSGREQHTFGEELPTTRARLAPDAQPDRDLRRRDTARASIRFAIFEHAMSRIRPTIAHEHVDGL